MNNYMVINKKTFAVIGVWPSLFECKWAMEQTGMYNRVDYTILEIEVHEVICP